MRWKGRIPFESLEFDAEVFWRWRNLRRTTAKLALAEKVS